MIALFCFCDYSGVVLEFLCSSDCGVGGLKSCTLSMFEMFVSVTGSVILRF